MALQTNRTVAASAARQRAAFADRNFKYFLVGPSIFVLLLIGIFPLVYLLAGELPGHHDDRDRHRLRGAAQLRAVCSTTSACGRRCCTRSSSPLIALPLELVLGLAMAQLFVDQLPGRQVFIALLVLPVVVSPIVSGATWSLHVQHTASARSTRSSAGSRGEEVTLLWTINPSLVYPSIIAAEVWQWTPFMFLLLLAALANVDKSQLEAAVHRRRRLLAHVLPHRAAGDLAGDGDGDPDPRAGPVPAVRHRLGAHAEAARAP